MGDISELRGLLFGVSFLGVFTICVLMIPAQLMYAPQYIQNRTSVPNTFDPSDVFFYAGNYTITMSNSSASGDFVIGGRTCNYDGWIASNVKYFGLAHYGGTWGIFKWDRHVMKVYDKSGIQISTLKLHMGGELGRMEQVITPAILDNQFLGQTNQSLRTYAKCDHFQFTEVYIWNQSLYALPSQAWDAGNLELVLLIRFDQVNTAYSAWDILGMLLFFQMPDIHWSINLMIALPLWITFAYIIFITILRVIGAVFGGGGA